ncbi:MAG: hypothetical protein WAK93_20075 [Solirubrobacteraceae bacterium]
MAQIKRWLFLFLEAAVGLAVVALVRPYVAAVAVVAALAVTWGLARRLIDKRRGHL